jgi:phosphoglycolate phosphatase-like HAD superfamily hydrolase
MIEALEFLKEPANNVISFGDRVVDIEASNAAGIESVVCLWGTKERKKIDEIRV